VIAAAALIAIYLALIAAIGWIIAADATPHITDEDLRHLLEEDQ
jgi:hypothetical protein